MILNCKFYNKKYSSHTFETRMTTNRKFSQFFEMTYEKSAEIFVHILVIRNLYVRRLRNTVYWQL